jgi:hypothetical protein
VPVHFEVEQHKDVWGEWMYSSTHSIIRPTTQIGIAINIDVGVIIRYNNNHGSTALYGLGPPLAEVTK